MTILCGIIKINGLEAAIAANFLRIFNVVHIFYPHEKKSEIETEYDIFELSARAR